MTNDVLQDEQTKSRIPAKLDHRTRIKRFFNSETIDRIPFVDWGGHPCFYDYKWKKEGEIPENADPFVLAGYDGSEGPGTEEIIDAAHHEGHFYSPTKGFEHVNYNLYALPQYSGEEWTDEYGYKYKIEPRSGGVSKRIPATKENPLGGLTCIRPPVITKKDWEKHKIRFNGKDINRYPFQAGEREVKRYLETKQVVNIGARGILTSPMSDVGWHGDNNFFDRLVDEPDYIEEMYDFYTNFSIDLMIPALEKFKIDTGSIVELLGYTEGLWVSKNMFTEILLPRYKRMVSKMKEYGVNYIFFDSIGPISDFIPQLLEIGINGIHGVPMASGMDVVKLKKDYGKDLFLMGGIDRRIISFGTKADIKKEVERVMSVVHLGGYLPYIDESIFYATPAENYFYYAEVLGKSLGVR